MNENDYHYISEVNSTIQDMERSNKDEKLNKMMKDAPLLCTKYFRCVNCGYISLSVHPCPICKGMLKPDFHWKKI
ncbi:MAG: hypothetical protein K9G58_05655 [Bacteroidales bacterium]|nr:hypothetical protein [Bacteroidales bacterium]MCF8397630.1 hypothetical protein [Bacteroidales bacterium]